MTKKPILCLDFDGVIHRYDSPFTYPDVIADEPTDGAIDFINRAREFFTIAIYSSRSNRIRGRTAMRNWLQCHMERELGLSRTNEVFPFIQWPTEKPPAKVTIDDRALTFTGTWPSISDLKSFQPWNKGPKTPRNRFCIVGDDSGHEYFIPFNRRIDWDTWLHSEDIDEVPDYATRIDGGTLVFQDPEIIR